jgi:hypothetical protein
MQLRTKPRMRSILRSRRGLNQIRDAVAPHNHYFVDAERRTAGSANSMLLSARAAAIRVLD